MASRRRKKDKTLVDHVMEILPEAAVLHMIEKATGVRLTSPPVVIFMKPEDFEARVRTIVRDELSKGKA